jgi:hypothetical protein
MSTSLAVRADTGEVLTPAVPFDMGTYLADLKGDRHLAQQKALAAVYDAACAALIGPNDVQVEGNRSFKKKSAWRKLARHFTISTAIVRIDKEDLNGIFCATVTVRAVAPWGQYAEEVGACATDEATGRRQITTADAIATAATRATNRAVSNLIAMGEVSAEEIGDRKSYGAAAAPVNAHAKKMPFGKNKGTPLGELDTRDLASAVDWCSSDAEKNEKFKDLIDACNEVLKDRLEMEMEPPTDADGRPL